MSKYSFANTKIKKIARCLLILDYLLDEGEDINSPLVRATISANKALLMALENGLDPESSGSAGLANIDALLSKLEVKKRVVKNDSGYNANHDWSLNDHMKDYMQFNEVDLSGPLAYQPIDGYFAVQ